LEPPAHKKQAAFLVGKPPVPYGAARRSGRSPTPPTILHKPPFGGYVKRAAVHSIYHSYVFLANFNLLDQGGDQVTPSRPIRILHAASDPLGKRFQLADKQPHLLDLHAHLRLRLHI